MPDLPRKTLAEWRKDRGYTQMRLASAIDVNLATISNLENGRNRPTFETVRKLAETLNILSDQIVWPAEVRRFPSKANRKKEVLAAA